MTTMGSEYWPKTVEGRVLSWLLSVYAFAIFGYITASIASYFVGQGREPGAERPSPDATVAAELAALRAEFAALGGRIEASTEVPNTIAPLRMGEDQ